MADINGYCDCGCQDNPALQLAMNQEEEPDVRLIEDTLSLMLLEFDREFGVGYYRFYDNLTSEPRGRLCGLAYGTLVREGLLEQDGRPTEKGRRILEGGS